MAAREAAIPEGPHGSPQLAPSGRSVRLGVPAALALVLVASVLIAIRLDAPAFFDNEGRYADVAREMVASGDYLTPHLDGTLFLNKPPLLYWLAAFVFRLAGPTEWARLVSIGAAAITLFATCRLGALLYGEAAGLVAGAALATTIGFVLEARTLRPDMIVVAVVVLALFFWQRARVGSAGRTAWLAAFYVVLSVGVLAKGLVPIVLVGIPVTSLTLAGEGGRGILQLRPVLGLLIVATVVVPWHALVAALHPGFAWDYIVNQHVLFFLDRKLPRDSDGDPLGFFWGAFAARAMPWALLLPLAVPEILRELRGRPAPVARAAAVVGTWAGGLLLFFSCAPSRLEHYALPALPASALLAARVWQRARGGELGWGAWAYLVGAGVAMAACGFTTMAVGRELLGRSDWISDVPAVLDLAPRAGVLLTATGTLLAAAAIRRRADFLVAILAASTVPLAAIVLRAEQLVEPLFSWRPAAQVLAMVPQAEIVFESPMEYQLVGGLAYYTGRQITLLEPRGFVPPTYLRSSAASMFLSRPEFERRWRSSALLALVSDPQRHRDDPQAIASGPLQVLARFGDRWVLANASAARWR